MQDYNDNNYDIDNVDLEEEMYLRDLQEEEEERLRQEEENSSDSDEEEDKKDEEASSDISSSDAGKRGRIKGLKTVKLSESYFDKQLRIRYENERDLFKFKYDVDGNIYLGKVIHKLREDNYVIDATIYKSEEPRKLKQFKLSKMHAISKKDKEK